MPPQNRSSRLSNSAFTAYLALMADSHWTTKRALCLWLTSSNWRAELIRRMQDDGYITCTNLNAKVKERRRRTKRKRQEEEAKNVREVEDDVPPYIYGLRYSLTAKGREYLRAFNPRKYEHMSDIREDAPDYDIRKIYRQSLLSEMRAMSELAGYSVHPFTKPYLTVLSNHPISMADRPAFKAFTASEIPPRFEGNENSFYNQGTFQYYEQGAKRTRTGYEHYDAKPYSYRETPIGCVYTVSELRALAEIEAEHSGGSQTDTDKLRFTKLSGVLFTSHGSYRLYNTERTAPKFRAHGEKNMEIFINAWSHKVYKASLQEIADDGNGNPKLIPASSKLKGTILFGDASHQAAVSVLRQTFQKSFGKPGAREKSRGNFNLDAMRNTYFIPVIQKAVPLYSMMLYPQWPYWLKMMGVEYLGTLHAERSEAPALVRGYIGDSFPHGEMGDGSSLLVLASLHLDTVRKMVDKLLLGEEEFTVVAMEWQKPFFDGLNKEMDEDTSEKLQVIYMPQSHLAGYAAWLHHEQENPFYAGPDGNPNI